MPRSKNIKILLNYVAGPAIFLLLAFVAWRQIHRQTNWRESFRAIGISLSGHNAWKLYLAIALMPVNWGIETLKWRTAIRPVQRVPFRRAMQAVFAGVTVASFTPNRVGEYLGRMLYLEDQKKAASIPGSVACSLAQMLATLVIGSWGCCRYANHVDDPHRLWRILFVVTCASAAALAAFYFRFDPILRLLARVARRFFPRRRLPDPPPVADRLFILGLSFFRYAVFIAQYYLLFSLFGVGGGLEDCMIVVSVLFVVMAAVPTFTFLTDLGVRWETGIQVLGAYGGSAAGVFATSLGIWLINLILPALIGSLLILKIKIFATR